MTHTHTHTDKHAEAPVTHQPPHEPHTPEKNTHTPEDRLSDVDNGTETVQQHVAKHPLTEVTHNHIKNGATNHIVTVWQQIIHDYSATGGKRDGTQEKIETLRDHRNYSLSHF